MDIQVEKLELIKMLAETENPSIIKEIKKIFQREKRDWWDELSDEQKLILNQADKEIDNGDFVTSEEFFDVISKK
jgi:hypothetical protein